MVEIQQQGWVHAGTYTDRVSASRYSTKDRPDWRRLQADIKAGKIDVVVTWEVSRGTRKLREYVDLIEVCQEGGCLWSYEGDIYDLTDDDDIARMGKDVLDAVKEAGRTRKRILRDVRHNAATGRPHGRLGYGFKRIYDEETGDFVRQELNLEQAEIIREAVRRTRKGESTYGIAQDFTRRGVPTPGRTGRPWDQSTIKRLLLNPSMIKKRVHQGKIVGVADWPRILTNADYYAVRAILNDPKRRTSRVATRRHWLSGAATCGVCGGRFCVQKNRGYLAYLCKTKFCVSREKDRLEEYISRLVVSRLSQPDAVDVLTGPDTSGIVAQALADAAEIQAELDDYYARARRREITAAGLAAVEPGLVQQIRAAEKRAEAARPIPTVVRDLVASDDIAAAWMDLDVAQKQVVLEAVFEHIKVFPTRRGTRTLDPATIDAPWREWSPE